MTKNVEKVASNFVIAESADGLAPLDVRMSVGMVMIPYMKGWHDC